MANADIGIDFGITNSDIVINSNNNLSYKSLRSEKNIHLSLNNILKTIQVESKIKSISVTGGKHLDLPDNFDGQKIVKKNGIISAAIDYSDHYSHTDNNIENLNFLQFCFRT